MRLMTLLTPHNPNTQFFQSVSSGSPNTVASRSGGVLDVSTFRNYEGIRAHREREECITAGAQQRQFMAYPIHIECSTIRLRQGIPTGLYLSHLCRSVYFSRFRDDANTLFLRRKPLSRARPDNQ